MSGWNGPLARAVGLPAPTAEGVPLYETVCRHRHADPLGAQRQVAAENGQVGRSTRTNLSPFKKWDAAPRSLEIALAPKSVLSTVPGAIERWHSRKTERL